MRLAELFSIVEHETSPHPEQDVISMDELKWWLAQSKQLPLTVAGAGENAGGSMVLFRYEYDSRNQIVILCSRLKQEEPVGYIRLKQDSERWSVEDLWLKKSLRGGGLITNLYRGLTADGYKLLSGEIVSTEAEKVWKRLGELKIAKVLDTETGKVEEFSLKPIGSGDKMHGVPPRYFWVTEGQQLLTVYSRSGSLAESRLQAWLSGKPVKFEEGTMGMGTFIVEAEV